MSDMSKLKEFFERLIADRMARRAIPEQQSRNDDFQQLLEFIAARGQGNKPYNRVLGPDERRAISPEAFGWLLHLLSLGTLDHYTFEKIMGLCVNLTYFLRRRVEKDMIEQILNMVLFSYNGEVSMKEIVEMFSQRDTTPKIPVVH